MFVWILVLYLHGIVANPRTIATLRMLIELSAARWDPLRRAAVSGREPDISPATARGRSARNP